MRGRKKLPEAQKTIETWPVATLATYLQDDVNREGNSDRMQSWYTHPDDRDFFDPAECDYMRATEWVTVSKASVIFWTDVGKYLHQWRDAEHLEQRIDNFIPSLTEQNRDALKSLFTDSIVVDVRRQSIDEGRHRVAALAEAGAREVIVSVRT